VIYRPIDDDFIDLSRSGPPDSLSDRGLCNDNVRKRD